MKVSILEHQVLKLIDLFIKSNYDNYSWNKKGNQYVFENQKGDDIIEYNQHFSGRPNILYIKDSFYDDIKKFVPFERGIIYDALAKWVENELDLRVGLILPSNILRYFRI